MDIHALILKCYNELQSVIEAETGVTDFDKKAMENLNGLHSKIDQWQPDHSIEFIWDYILGEGANSVSGQGMARTAMPNFKLFIEDAVTQEKIKELFMIRKTLSLDKTVLEKIDEIAIHDHLENFSFSKGYKPRLYLNRFLLMIFIEVMTTIAYSMELNKVRKKLDITENKSFAKMQFQIREKVNDALKELNIVPKTKFEAATIAWHIARVDM